MNWSTLPSELQEKILTLVPSRSIPQCKQVCKSWKDIIETRLNKNMFGEVSKFVEKVETIEVGDLGDDGNEREFELWGACENNIVIKSDDRYNRDNYINLMVYNLVTKDTCRIGSIGPLANESEGVLYFHISKTLFAICYKSDINLLRSEHKVLKVFSLETKEIVFEDIVPDTVCKVQIDQSSSLLVLLHSTKIEVLSFNNNSLSRFSTNTQLPLHFEDDESAVENDVNVTCWYSETSMSFPNLSHFEVNEENGKYQISAFVWKINDEKKQVKRHKYYADFGSYLQLTHDKKVFWEAFYVSSSFIVITKDGHDAKSINYLLKVLNDEGELLKTIQFNPRFGYLGSYMHENRLVIHSLEEGVKFEMNMFDLRELLNSEANNNLSMKRFPGHVVNYDLVFSDDTSITIIDLEKGKLIVRRLDFWVNE